MAGAEAEAEEDGAVAAFGETGLRWAFQQLQTRAQVAAVMEEMLATVEVSVGLVRCVAGWHFV